MQASTTVLLSCTLYVAIPCGVVPPRPNMYMYYMSETKLYTVKNAPLYYCITIASNASMIPTYIPTYLHTS